MFDTDKLDRIRSKTDEDKLNELIEAPEIYCSDFIYLLDYHLSTDIKESLRNHLTTFREYIIAEQDGFVAESILSIVLMGDYHGN